MALSNLISTYVHRILPCTKRLDKILFYSNSKGCFSDYVDVDTVVMSILFDRTLKVPDVESAVQILKF